MLGTATAIIAIILLYLFPQHLPTDGGAGLSVDFSTALYLLPFMILMLQIALFAITIIPLQRMEEKMIPRISDLLKGDSYHKGIQTSIFLLALVLLFTTLAWRHVAVDGFPIMLGGTILLLGIIFDLFHRSIIHTQSYLNPFTALKMLRSRGEKSISQGKEAELCDWIDALLEGALKALSRNSPSLCNAALQESSNLMHAYLNNSTKKLADTNVNNSAFIAIEEKARFLLFYLFDRLETIYRKALDQDLGSICSSITTLLGKLALHAAEYKVSFATHPIQLLGKFTLQAAEKKALESTLKGTITLVELSKAIAENVDPAIPDFKDPFFSALVQLDEIAKEAFRKDKSINIKLLTYPFLDLKAFFQTEAMQARINSPLIVNEINRLLAEWDTLETVMRTMPPKLPQEQK